MSGRRTARLWIPTPGDGRGVRLAQSVPITGPDGAVVGEATSIIRTERDGIEVECLIDADWLDSDPTWPPGYTLAVEP